MEHEQKERGDADRCVCGGGGVRSGPGTRGLSSGGPALCSGLTTLFVKKRCLRRVGPKLEFHGCLGEENIFIAPLVPFQSIV